MRRLLLALGLSAALIGLALPSASTARTGLPDLIVAGEYMGNYRFDTQTFEPGSCAIVEGMVPAAGTYRLLMFTTLIPNIGETLRIGKPSLSNPDWWEYSNCHDHWHLKGYAHYRLLDQAGNLVSAGHKMGFCVIDVVTYLPDYQGNAPRFSCSNMGISHGWADQYRSTVPGQWVIISDVPPGDYNLVVTVNPDRLLTESNYDNNTATVPVAIP
jgi:hypothetical protein